MPDGSRLHVFFVFQDCQRGGEQVYHGKADTCCDRAEKWNPGTFFRTVVQLEKIQGKAYKAGRKEIKTVKYDHANGQRKSCMYRKTTEKTGSIFLIKTVCKDQSQNQKGKITDKHDLSVCLKHTVGSQIKKSSGKAQIFRDIFFLQPPVKQPGSQKHLQNGIALNKDFHGDIWEKEADQYVRTEKTIIGKRVKVCTVAKRAPVRQQLPGFQKLLTHGVCNGHMLTIPVCSGTKKLSLGKCDPYEQKNCSGKKYGRNQSDSGSGKRDCRAETGSGKRGRTEKCSKDYGASWRGNVLDGKGGHFSDENKHSSSLTGDFDLVLKY